MVFVPHHSNMTCSTSLFFVHFQTGPQFWPDVQSRHPFFECPAKNEDPFEILGVISLISFRKAVPHRCGFCSIGTFDPVYGPQARDIAITCLGHLTSPHREESRLAFRLAWLRGIENHLRTKFQLEMRNKVSRVIYQHSHIVVTSLHLQLDFRPEDILGTSEPRNQANRESVPVSFHGGDAKCRRHIAGLVQHDYQCFRYGRTS